MAPLYIAEYYKKNKMVEESANAYKEALAHYRSLVADLGEIKMTALVQNYVAMVYASQSLWDEAVSEWENIVLEYPKSSIVPYTSLILGETYFTQLKERTKAVEKYVFIIESYPNSEYSLRAISRLIKLYFVTGDYDKVREYSEMLVDASKGNREVEAQAMAIIARSYEKQGDWEKAESMYQSVMEDYSDTVVALRIPLFMALHYKSDDEASVDVEKIYSDALDTYSEVMDANDATSSMKQVASELSTLVSAKQENWHDVANNLDAAWKNESFPVSRRSRALYVMAYVYAEKLKDKEKSLVLYADFLEMYPDHPLVGSVNKQVEKLSAL